MIEFGNLLDEHDIIQESSNKTTWNDIEDILGYSLPEDFKEGIDQNNTKYENGVVKFDNETFCIQEIFTANEILKYRKQNNYHMDNDNYLAFGSDGMGNALILYHLKDKFKYGIWIHDQFAGENDADHMACFWSNVQTWDSFTSKINNNINESCYTQEEYDVYLEYKIDAAERNELDDSDFGIPELRKYPLTDKIHVQKAVQMFSHCPDKYKKQLKRRILSRAHKFGMDTSKWESLKNHKD